MVGRSFKCAALLLAGFLLPLAGSAPRLSEAQKVAIIRNLIAEVGIARQALPPDKKGVEIAPGGRVLNSADVQQSLLDHGRAAVPGDRIAITSITFKDDRIIFAINGGPHTTHWYDHISMSMGGSSQPVNQNSQVAVKGAQITLRFPHDVPGLSVAEVRADLNTLIDWDPPSEAVEMVKALPAPVKAAIAAHHVLVGMNTDMVVAALGRTGNKTRETDALGQEYEDWVYGEPPAATQFVRIQDNRVIRIVTYEPGGQQIVETQPDPALAAMAQRSQAQAASAATQAAEPPPTLRRPGDPAPTVSRAGAASAPAMPSNPGMNLPGMPDPSTASPPNGMPPTSTGMPPISGPPICCSLPH